MGTVLFYGHKHATLKPVRISISQLVAHGSAVEVEFNMQYIRPCIGDGLR